MPFCSGEFPGQYKRLCNALLSSLFSTDRPHQYEESAFNIWATVPLGDRSFIIYSFLLDQLDLKTSGWMLNSSSNICNHFLLFIRLTVQEISSQADIKVLEHTNILVDSFVLLLSSYNKATGLKTQQFTHFYNTNKLIKKRMTWSTEAQMRNLKWESTKKWRNKWICKSSPPTDKINGK